MARITDHPLYHSIAPQRRRRLSLDGWAVDDQNMAVSFYSVLGFNSSTLQAKYQNVPIFSSGASIPAVTLFTSSFGTFGARRHINRKRWGLCLSVADSNQLTTETGDKATESTSTSPSEDPLKAVNSSSLGSSAESTSQIPEASNGSSVSSSQELKDEASPQPSLQSKSKRSPLTARERLRAAKVLSRYNTESKPTKKKDRSKTVLDAARASDGGKRRSGLPEAPTNIFDDSKRGMPKQGLTWDFPGGADLFLIVFSFVFISTVMFATTYLVWKVGAIHFNEN